MEVKDHQADIDALAARSRELHVRAQKLQSQAQASSKHMAELLKDSDAIFEHCRELLNRKLPTLP